jgi:hypothetical protein
LADAYSGAARRSLMAVSLDPYTNEHVIERNTYDLPKFTSAPWPPSTALRSTELTQGICGAGSVPADLPLLVRISDTDRTIILTIQLASRERQPRPAVRSVVSRP